VELFLLLVLLLWLVLVASKNDEIMMVSTHQLHWMAKSLASLTVVTMTMNVLLLLSPPLQQQQPHQWQPQQAAPSSMHDLLLFSHSTRTKLNRNNNNNKNMTFTTSAFASQNLPPLTQKQQVQPKEFSTQSWTEAEGRQYMMDIFRRAGVMLTPEMVNQLPTWSQVRQVVGDYPHVLNLSTCSTFRSNVPPLERMIGSSGMFNTGTNLVTHLLKQNCEIPERREYYGPHQSKESYGMRWQVPVSEVNE
jgi:hypothetical protein